MTYTDIVGMIMRSEPLQTVMDAMAEYLQAALIFNGDSMEILAFSKSVPVRDLYWAKSLEKGYCTEEMLERVYQSSLVKNQRRIISLVGGPSYPPDNVTLKHFYAFPPDPFCASITVTGMPLDGKFDKQKQDLLLSFASLVKNTYLRADFLPLAYRYRGSKSILQRLLNRDYERLLDADVKNRSEIDSSFFEDIQILVFSTEFQECSDTILYALADSISLSLGNDYTTIYNGFVVAVLQKGTLTENCKEQLLLLAKKSNAKIGISWSFSGKEQVRRHYKQAVFAIETARKARLSGHYFTYDDMYIHAMLDQCRRLEHWADIEHPVLTRLREYDAEHSSCLYQTLSCLLKCGMNSSLAAKRLGVHKSTLYHRTEVLQDLIPGLMDKSADWQTSVMLAFDMASPGQ